ncbi:hypothetical protein ACFQ1L_01260 [Phytohabitans flavus]|uniref:hypothetical protein n=1 Tax=Phytohabitans flavus TaxID=1076124 RepID=UPI001E55E45B|nr:hypothetical protein [Phytohabitans flavus]
MGRVQFLIRVRDDLNVHEVVPAVDGALLTDLVDVFELAAGMQPAGAAYGGLIPAFFRFGPLDKHFHGRSTSTMGPKTPLLGCECGEWGCWPLTARIAVTERSVTWDAFEQPHRPTRDYAGFGPFRFERRRYDAALEGLCLEIAALEV